MTHSKVFTLLAISAAVTSSARAALTTFSYSQDTMVVGSGVISAFVVNDVGGPINFAATPMPAATVFNPVPGSTPAGYVGAMNAQAGNSNEANQAVGLLWSGAVTATGTRGADVFTISIPLTFVTEVNQTPADTNDYNWSVAYGDNPALGVDAVTGSNRFAFYLSRDTVIDATETANTFQRYTQLNHTFAAGVQDSFTNTDTTNGTIKDATDAGAPAGTDAAGRDLGFYWGWRDGGSLTSGAILVDNFAVGGLLNADEGTLALIPEPSSGLMVIGSAGFLFLRRRRRN